MYRLERPIQIALLVLMILFFLFLGVPIGVMIGYWNDLPSLDSLEYENRSWQYPTKVYSDISLISPGTTLESLLKRLQRLNYERVNGEPVSKGQFNLKNPENSKTNMVRLFLRELYYPRLNRDPVLVVIQIENGSITKINNAEGLPLDEFILEPEVIDEFYSGEGIDREIVKLSHVPGILSKAFLAIEDKRFYKHAGIDPYRVIGAILWDIRHLSKGQGGSTLTQQLARDLFLTREKLVTRKFKEWLLALKIERKYTKDEILERYLNRVNLGRVGSREIYGVEQAAKYYFGKHVWELNLPESATLAGIPRWPPKYSPIKNPENAKVRRQVVLRQMLDLGFINEAQYEEAVGSPLVTVSMGESWSMDVAYVLEYVRSKLEEKYESSAIYGQGLSVYTTLDMSIQLAANGAVQKHLRILDRHLGFPDYEENKSRWFAKEREKGVVSPDSYVQSALVAIEPATGYIKAMVGGRDFSVNQFNRAVQAQRQPGSAFKPFVYCTAFASKPPVATPADIIIDEPWGVRMPDKYWEPKNYSHLHYGAVTVRKALTRSLNVPTARLLYEKVGVGRAIDIAKSMGINSPLAHVPSIALGSSEVNVLEITSAYGVWADQGLRAEPICIKYVLDRENNILEENKPVVKKVLEKNVAYQTTYLMRGVVDGGTGSRIRTLGFRRPAAGKTGTTNDNTDAWFIGFVPDLVTGVWVGFDDYSKSTRRTGADAALPIWADFMKTVVDGPVKDFTVPSGIVFREVDPNTGLPPTDESVRTIREAFLVGTEPEETSDVQRGNGNEGVDSL